MELRQYLALLRRNWALIAGTTLIGIVLTAVYSLLSTPIYSSTAQLFMAIPGTSGDAASDIYSGALFAQQRVRSYASIVDSPGVLEPVIQELGLQTSPAALAGRISAANPTNTILINISASAASPLESAAIANSTAKHFAEEIVRLETPKGSQTSPVKPSITRAAVPPYSPTQPKTTINIFIGAVLGLVAGVAIAVLRNTLDTTVKTGDDLVQATESTVLGFVNFDSQAKTQPLAAMDQGSMRSEAFRIIRTNLQFIDVDSPPRLVVITSAVPAEGKSTTTANLAISMAQSGSRVLVVEADLRRPSLSKLLGLDGERGLTNLLIGECSLDEVLVSWNRGLLDVIASGSIPPNPSELLGSQQMQKLLESLGHKYDIILLDTPPLLAVADGAVLASLADAAILVTRHGRARRDQVAEAALALHRVNAHLIGAVLNFIPIKHTRKGYGYGYGYGHGYGYGYGYGQEKQRSEVASSGSTSREPGLPLAPETRLPSRDNDAGRGGGLL